jgi:hypothetical protein
VPRDQGERIAVQQQQTGAFPAVAKIDLDLGIARLYLDLLESFEHVISLDAFA